MRFTDFYACSAVCTPSRAGFVTGRYPVRFGLNGVLWPKSEGGLPAEELTVAEVLKQRGYATMCAGKWHLGRPDAYLPTSHGFDRFFGIPYSHDMQRDPKDPNSPELPLMENTRVIEAPARLDTLTERYTRETIRFMTVNRNRPFFVYLAHSAPHTPLHVGAEFRDRSAGGRYGDVIEELDDSTGQILDALQRLKLDDNTLVVFTSDNGPWLMQGANGGSASSTCGA